MIHNLEGFKTFFESVDQCYQEIKGKKTETSEEMVFATQVKTMFLKFTPREINELHYLLESALIDYHMDLTRFAEQEPCEN